MTNRQALMSLMLLLTVSMRIRIIQAVPDYYDDDYDNLESELQDQARSEPEPEAEPKLYDEPEPEPESEGEPEPESEPEPEPLPQESSDVGSDVELRQQATENSNAIQKLAGIMSTLITQTSTQRCLNTGTNTEELATTIRDGFTILVGAVQDLNITLHHYKAEISRKTFGKTEATSFGSDGPCPSPFFMAGDKCLYVETERLRFFDAARQACLDMGAKLAEFDDFEPFIQAVANMDLHEEAEIYMGATDADHEGRWTWLSGGTIGRIPWGEDEPNNAGDREHCLSYKTGRREFNDVPCSFRREYACVLK